VIVYYLVVILHENTLYIAVTVSIFIPLVFLSVLFYYMPLRVAPLSFLDCFVETNLHTLNTKCIFLIHLVSETSRRC
jgi:hypothetical protein